MIAPECFSIAGFLRPKDAIERIDYDMRSGHAAALEMLYPFRCPSDCLPQDTGLVTFTDPYKVIGLKEC